MTDRAVLIGIDEYYSLRNDIDPNQRLEGCVYDAKDLRDFLCQERDFDSGNACLLLDSHATKQEIKKKLRWLAGGTQRGDRLLFHFSGHGAQILGSELSQDAICAYDFDPSTGDGAFTRNDLRGLLSTLPPGVEFIGTLDSCYSGGLVWARAGKVAPRVRLFPLPARAASKIEDARKRKVQRIALADAAAPLEKALIAAARKQGVKWLLPTDAAKPLNGAFISACGPDDHAYETDDGVDGHANGAFTLRLLEQLAAPGGLDDPLRTIFKKVAEDLEEQNPQLSGSDDVKERPWMKSP